MCCGTQRALCPVARGRGQLVSREGQRCSVAKGVSARNSLNDLRRNHGNQTVPFWADRLPQIIENLSTSMSWVRSIGARAFIAGLALAGMLCLALAFSHWHSSDPVKFVCYLIAALLASSLKMSLPGIEGTLSVNFLFTLMGILELSLPETLAIGLASTLGQFYWKPTRRLTFVQLVFNLSQVTVSSAAAYAAYKLVVLYVHSYRSSKSSSNQRRVIIRS